MPIPFTGKCDFVYDSKGDTPCRDLLLPATEEEANEVVTLEWPPGFRFGAATSAYQVEGGIVDTNWNRWEDMRVRGDGKETVRPNADGSVGAGKATDMWNLFESVDLPMIKQLGLSTFRFSVEWSRVQPKRDVFDQAAVDRYARWCQLLRAEGIEPMVTLLRAHAAHSNTRSTRLPSSHPSCSALPPQTSPSPAGSRTSAAGSRRR